MRVLSRGGRKVPRLPPPEVFFPPPPCPFQLGMVFCYSLASASGLFVFLQPYGFWSFCSPGLDPVVVVVPRQKTKCDLGCEATIWCVSSAESLIWFSLFGFHSLVSNMLSSTASSKTRASPQWSPASSGPAASNHGRVGPSRSARGLHAPGKSLPGLARVGHGLSSRVRFHEVFWRISAAEEVSGDGATRRRSRFVLLFYGVLFHFLVFFSHFSFVMLKSY